MAIRNLLKFLVWIFWICEPFLAQSALPEKATNLIAISSVDAAGKSVPISRDGAVQLKAFPKNVYFHYGPNSNALRAPMRLRDRLEGFNNDWHAGIADMNLTIRFYSDSLEHVGQTVFKVRGESTGWTGSLTNSPLTHRQETVTAPTNASRLMIVLSSAGPPDTKGVYVVAHLTVSQFSSNLPPVQVMSSPFDKQPLSGATDLPPQGWMRDGTRAAMAKVLNIGTPAITKALAILDDDAFGHAEWHNDLRALPRITPGEKLAIEWNEMFSIGDGGVRWDRYEMMPGGNYCFRVQEVDVFGVPTGEDCSLRVVVLSPFWSRPWFWGIVLIALIAATFGTGRYMTWHRMRREIARLQSQQALERERLRLARDIHDDLGARVTEISLLSAMSQDEASFSPAARDNFAQISQLARQMVSALYETVWAVNPENDNLEALGDYLAHIVNQLCGHAQLSCCLYIQELPREVQLSSQMRHNISMVVKEAVHNAIKHAQASQVSLHAQLSEDTLRISVQDNGRGFQPRPAGKLAGNGLSNMQRRMAEIGGQCVFESQVGQGTRVNLTLPLAAVAQHLNTAPYNYEKTRQRG